MYYCFRLVKGDDLKKIENYVIENKISGVILSAVGCLSQLHIRLADGKRILNRIGQLKLLVLWVLYRKMEYICIYLYLMRKDVR